MDMDLINNDIVIRNGDISIADYEQSIVNAIKQRLSTFKGEWFLDVFFGPDYRKYVLVKNPREDIVTVLLKKEINKTIYGTFTEFSIEIDSDRNMTLAYSLDTKETTLTDVVTL